MPVWVIAACAGTAATAATPIAPMSVTRQHRTLPARNLRVTSVSIIDREITVIRVALHRFWCFTRLWGS
jgi:hypothetical protein